MKLWHALAVVVAMGISAAAFADTYSVDPVHSSAYFRIKHMNTAYVYGRINGPEGTVVYDAAKPEDSKFEITLKADNIDTANKMRDTDLKSTKFFNAKEFPTLTFKSTSVKKGEGNKLDVTGDLTIHGVTKSVTVPVEHTGDGKNMNGTAIAGFEAFFTVKRSDFGMKEMLEGIADEVMLAVSLETQKK